MGLAGSAAAAHNFNMGSVIRRSRITGILFFSEVKMAWREILLVLIRCELQARYSHFSGWQLTAKRALPVILALSLTLFLRFHG